MNNTLKILTFGTLIALTTSSIADNNYYLTAKVGANYMQSIVDKDGSAEGCKTLKCKSKPAFIYIIGAGVDINENFRADLTFEEVRNPVLKDSANVADMTFKGKHKGNIQAVMANGYLDIFENNSYKFILGTGVGVSRVREVLSGSCNDNTGNLGGFSSKSKTQYNVAYHLSTGVSKKFEAGYIVEVLYSWRDYGKTGSLKENAANAKSRYKSNNVIVGLRLPI